MKNKNFNFSVLTTDSMHLQTLYSLDNFMVFYTILCLKGTKNNSEYFLFKIGRYSQIENVELKIIRKLI